MGLVDGRGRFSTLHSSETPRPIFMKLEIYNYFPDGFRLRNDLYCVGWGFKLYSLIHYFPDTTLHAKFQGPMSTWVVWANNQFDAWKFLSFISFLSHAHSRIFGHIPTLNTSLCVVPPKKCLLGLKRCSLKFTPLYPHKTYKLRLNWLSLDNYSHHNSRTVTTSNFAQVLTTKVATRDITPRSRDHKSRWRHVTYSVKNCNNSVLVGPIKFVFGINMGATPN